MALNRRSIQALCFLLVCLAGFVPYFFFKTDGPRGAVLAVVALMTLVILSLTPGCLTQLRPSRTGSLAVGLLVLTVGYGLVMGYLNNNASYYMAADLFHWGVELGLVGAVTVMAFKGLDASQARRLVICVSAGIALVTILLIAGCYAGLFPAGGYFQGGSRFWHLKAGIAFPEISLIILVIALLCGERDTKAWELFGWIAVVILVLVLVMTLKRTMWLSFVVAIACVIFPFRPVRIFGVVSCFTGALLVTLVIMNGAEVFSLLDFLSYNDAYRVQDTMVDRENQFIDAAREIGWLGKGLGAEFLIYDVGENKVADLHYVHSLYLFDLLQMGVWVAGAHFLFLANLVYQLHKSNVWNSSWIPAAALACIIALTLNGVTLVSIHSAFAGVALGLAVLSFRVE